MIVKKWKDLVDAEKKTKGDAAPSVKKAVEGEWRETVCRIAVLNVCPRIGSASPASKGSGTPNATAGTPVPASPVVTKTSINGSIGPASALKTAHPASPATPEPKSSTPIDFECLQDKVRNACLKLLHQSLETNYKGPDKGLVFETALLVEKACYEGIGKSNTSGDYRSKVRSLSLNLKDKANPTLRGSVLDGRLLPERLVVMKPEEMASDARKAERQRLQIQNLFNAKAAEDQQAETDAFECARCKQRKCTYYQKQVRGGIGAANGFDVSNQDCIPSIPRSQTRSADEPMTGKVEAKTTHPKQPLTNLFHALDSLCYLHKLQIQVSFGLPSISSPTER